MRLSPHLIRALADRLVSLPRSTWAGEIARMSGVWSCHPSTVRRLLSQAGCPVGDKTGGRGSKVSDDDVRLVAALQATSIRKGHVGLPTRRALEVLEREGVTIPGSVQTVQRRQRELAVAAADLVAPSPHRNMVSTHANHVHQLDVSLCIQYEFGPKGVKLRYTDPAKLDQYQKIKKAIHRWRLTDHLSGYSITMYVEAGGERVEDAIRFLFYCWGMKEDTRVQFCGVPDILYVDRGPAFISGPVRHLCAAFGVQLLWHQAGNPRAKGSVESSHWVHERAFESRLRLQKIPSVEALIKAAAEEDLRMNLTEIHTRHGMTRAAAWEAAVPKPVRVPTEDFDAFCWLAHGVPDSRVVGGDLSISWKGEAFRVDAPRGSDVLVLPHPWLPGMIRVTDVEGNDLGCEKVVRDDWGFPTDGTVWGTHTGGHTHTPAQRIKDIEIPAFTQVFTPTLPSSVYAQPQVITTPARVGVAEPPAPTLDVMVAREAAYERLGRPLTREEARWWAGAVGDEVSPSALPDLLTQFLSSEVVTARVVDPVVVRADPPLLTLLPEVELPTLDRGQAKDIVLSRLACPLTREQGRWWNERLGEEGVTREQFEVLWRQFVDVSEKVAVA